MSNKAGTETINSNTDVANDVLLFLDPDNITEPEETNVRPFSVAHGDTEQEIAAIEALGRSIAQEGQIQPGKVMMIANAKPGEPQYMLIAGRRRRRAIQMHNMSLDTGIAPLPFKAVLTHEDMKKPKLFRQAAHENLQRAGLSPMDFALDIQNVCKKFKWPATREGLEKAAAFFEVSYATVQTHSSLLSLPEDVQLRVHNGEISRDDAFKLVQIAKKEGAEVASQTATAAVEAGKQVETAAEAAADMSADMVDEVEVIDAANGDAANAPGKKKKAAKKKVVAAKKAAAAAKSKVITEKLRTVDPNKPVPRSRKEIIEFFEGVQGPAYGHPNGAVHVFARNFILWCAGSITDRTVEKYFDKLVETADKGTPEEVKEDAPKDKTPAVKKSATSAAKKSAVTVAGKKK